MAAIRPILTPVSGGPVHSTPLLNALKGVILLLIVGAAAYLLLTHRQWFDNPTLIKREVLQWGMWGPLVFIVLYAVGPSLLLPGAVMTAAAGLAFGTLWGAAYSLLGANIGAVVAFAAGRMLGKSLVERLVSGRLEAALAAIARHGFRVTLYLRMVPVIPYNAFNLLAGASPIAFRDYFWASVIGMIPGTILFAFLGDAMWHPASARFFVAIGLILTCLGMAELWRRYSRSPIPL
jgi:uncharacterized membrane protein YdjX (TVP38/TMEM64 family)